MRVNEAVKMRILELCQQNNITLNKLSTICGTMANINHLSSASHRSAVALDSQRSSNPPALESS